MPVVDKNKLLRQTTETKHEIPIDPDDPDAVMEVWIRDISFFDIQLATQELFDIGQNGIYLLILRRIGVLLLPIGL